MPIRRTPLVSCPYRCPTARRLALVANARTRRRFNWPSQRTLGSKKLRPAGQRLNVRFGSKAVIRGLLSRNAGYELRGHQLGRDAFGLGGVAVELPLDAVRVAEGNG